MSEQRGGGRLAGALASRRRQSGGEAEQQPGTVKRRGSRERKEPARVGKSRDSRYRQALGYIRKDVHRLVVDQALRNPEVLAALLPELDQRGVEHKAEEADYGALVELLLLEWLESVGYRREQ